jgi:hypothetical protein
MSDAPSDSRSAGRSRAMPSHSKANPFPPNQPLRGNDLLQGALPADLASQLPRPYSSEEAELNYLPGLNSRPDHDAGCTCHPCALAKLALAEANLALAQTKIDDLESDKIILEHQVNSLLVQLKNNENFSPRDGGGALDNNEFDDSDDDDDDSDASAWADLELKDGEHTNPNELQAYQPSFVDELDDNFSPSKTLTGEESFSDLLECYVDYLLEIETFSYADLCTCHTKIHEAIQELKMNGKRRDNADPPPATKVNFLIRYLTALLEVIRTQRFRHDAKTNDIATFLIKQDDMDMAVLSSLVDDQDLYTFACNHLMCDPCAGCKATKKIWNITCQECQAKRTKDGNRYIVTLRNTAAYMLKQVGLAGRVQLGSKPLDRREIDRLDVVLLCLAPTILSQSRIINATAHKSKLRARLLSLRSKPKNPETPSLMELDVVTRFSTIDEDPIVTSSKKLYFDKVNNDVLALW